MLLEDPIRALEDSHAAVRQRGRVHDRAVAVDEHLQPVLDAADHDRDHGSHVVRSLAFGVASIEAALDGLCGSYCLRER